MKNLLIINVYTKNTTSGTPRRFVKLYNENGAFIESIFYSYIGDRQAIEQCNYNRETHNYIWLDEIETTISNYNEELKEYRKKGNWVL
jgi:hypothetical protein